MLTVINPGARTLIEDTGRHGYAHLGVPTSGAADPHTLALANHLVGNTPDTAALEITLHGPTLRFDHPAVVAYAGPDTDVRLNGHLAPTHHTIALSPGDVLDISTLRDGVYGYLAIAGGITTTPVLGSRSTCTLSALGPAPLAAGDTLPLPACVDPNRPRAALTRRTLATNGTVRYLPGPHQHLFDPTALRDHAWTVDPQSSRVGVRLAGATLDHPDTSIPSLGMVTGAIQVPPSGQPIVLGPDHGTTGGYPVIAVVHPDDLPTLMQTRPGYPLRFVPATDHDTTGTPIMGPVAELAAISA